VGEVPLLGSFFAKRQKTHVCKKGRARQMKEDELKAATSRLSRAAKEEMAKWKREKGIKAILPKTANQKAEMRRYNRTARTLDRHEMRKISHGAASEVRVIKPEDL